MNQVLYVGPSDPRTLQAIRNGAPKRTVHVAHSLKEARQHLVNPDIVSAIILSAEAESKDRIDLKKFAGELVGERGFTGPVIVVGPHERTRQYIARGANGNGMHCIPDTLQQTVSAMLAA